MGKRRSVNEGLQRFQESENRFRQVLERELDETQLRHHYGEYRVPEEARDLLVHFWLRSVDALSHAKAPVWISLSDAESRIWELSPELLQAHRDRGWFLTAVKAMRQLAITAGLDFRPLLWFKRYLGGGAFSVDDRRALDDLLEMLQPDRPFRQLSAEVASAVSAAPIASAADDTALENNRTARDDTQWTRPMSKSEAAKHLRCPHAKKADWINQCVADGTLRIRPDGPRTRQSCQFNLDAFPPELHDKLGATSSN